MSQSTTGVENIHVTNVDEIQAGLPTLAAISTLITAAQNALAALFFFRQADPNNTIAAGNIPGGGAVTTLTAKSTRGLAAWWFALTNANAGTFYVFHGDVEADVNNSAPGALVGATVQDVWTCAAGYAAFLFPVAVRSGFIRAYFVGTAGTNFALTATADPRPVDHLTSFSQNSILVPQNPATLDVAIPPGTRFWGARTVQSGGVTLTANGTVAPAIAGYGDYLILPANIQNGTNHGKFLPCYGESKLVCDCTVAASTFLFEWYP